MNFRKVILKRSPSIDETGSIVWQLLLALFLAWLLVFSMVLKGIKVT